MFVNKLAYITESKIPNTNAEIIHVLKICDSFTDMGYETTIISPYISENKEVIKENYNLKNDMRFISNFSNEKKFNFLYRFINIFKTYHYIKKKNFNIIISRSILCSIFLNILNIVNALEVHHEMTGFTKKLFNFLKKIKKINNIRFILLHENLKKIILSENFDIKFRILDDGVNPEEFKINTEKTHDRTCCYTGSFYSGKGVEIIEKLAQQIPSIHFHLYGDKKFLKKKLYPSNLFFFDFVPYRKIPRILSSYEVLLMPYTKHVKVRSNVSNISNYMSPLKLFEYLASGKILMASKIEAYNHILKNEHNSFLFEEKDIETWAKKILEVFNNLKKYDTIRTNSIKTAYKYTWNNRAKKIEDLMTSSF